MITVRTRRRIGMMQQQLGGNKEQAFVLSLGQNFLDFIDKYSEVEDYSNSLLYTKMEELIKAEDYKGVEAVFEKLQIFGTYDKVTQFTTKYKNVSSAVGRTFNGTVFEGHVDEKAELERIVAHTCGLCSSKGNEFVEKMLA